MISTKMVTFKYTIEEFAEMIDLGISFMRWGDGEMSAVLGRPIGGTDANGHQYFEGLSADLREVLTERIQRPEEYDYALGMQDLGIDLFREEWQAFIGKAAQYNTHPAWILTDVLAKAIHWTDPPGLMPIVKALNKRQVIVVGPRFLEGKLPFDYDLLIDIPERDCYLEIHKIAHRVSKAAISCKYPVIALSCGMAAKPLLHWLHPLIKRIHGCIFDFGSLWDAFAGRTSRSYQLGLPNNLLEVYHKWQSGESA